MKEITKKDLNFLKEAIEEAKNIKKSFEEQNGKCSTRIANKDILFWLITDKYKQDNEINILKTKFKYLEKIFYGAIVGIILLVIGVVVT